MDGIVSNIQRFSLHDGPGIRTTVFLQGCQMHCAWCHNPEMIPLAPRVLWYAEKCVGCGACHGACGRLRSELERRKCGEYAARCPAGAIRFSGRQMSAATVMREVLADREFYGSDGGVTLSGGEPLLQAPFAAELLKLCQGNGIHTAIETNLDCEWSLLSPLLNDLDLIMFDLKCMDDAVHRKYTGTGNERILENIQKLGQTGKSLIARTPLVSGVNDSDANLKAAAALLTELDELVVYELLPYHPLGAEKYRAAGLSEPEFHAPDQKRIEQLKRLAQNQGVKAR